LVDEIVSGITDQTPTNTELPPTHTVTPPSDTPEPSPTEEAPVIGGADKIAFIDKNDIWLMNVDGSNLQQMTTDGALKTSLGWTPDGSALTYISGRCIWYIDIESDLIDFIACFESAEYLENFTFSPDGSQVAISLNRELYVVPYDLERLQSVRFNRDLKEMSECSSLAPVVNFNGNPEHIKLWRWSNDGDKMIIIKLANISGTQGDLIQILDFSSCEFAPNRTDEIPANRFSIEGYNNNPRIEDFGFDGASLISLVSFNRNDGYGHLYIYNTISHRVDLKINPINNECCYRDPKFSPDGRYIVLVFQPYEANARSQLYYISYGTIGSGASYQPIQLPEEFFTDPRVKPQPVLRPAN
jgi:Tol biopolymer transport system component